MLSLKGASGSVSRRPRAQKRSAAALDGPSAPTPSSPPSERRWRDFRADPEGAPGDVRQSAGEPRRRDGGFEEGWLM